jgi:hypothetical protein
LVTTLSGFDENGNPVSVKVTQFESESTSLIYGFNLGFDSFVAENISIQVNMQYYATEYEFDLFGLVEVSNGNSGTVDVSQSYPFKTLNMTIGFGYHFN